MKAFENISWGIFIVCAIYYGLVEYEIIFPPQELTDGIDVHRYSNYSVLAY